MKQEFSPGKGNALQTLQHNAEESASPQYARHGEAQDSPFVVVKLEDEPSSSGTESEESEWMRPVDSSEDEDEEHANNGLVKDEYPRGKAKENNGTSSSSHEDAGIPKKRASKPKNKRITSHSTRGRAKTSPGRNMRSAPRFSKSQEELIQTFMESHGKDLFGPNMKGPDERQSLWEELISLVNAEATERERWKTAAPPSARKRLCQTGTHHHHHPSARSQECGPQAFGSSAAGASAPYSRSKPASAISPELAAEPPSFPSMEYDGKAQCCKKLEGAIFDVLNFCKSMCTAIQRLEEKIDSLQSNSSHNRGSHLNFPVPEEVSRRRGACCSPEAKARHSGMFRGSPPTQACRSRGRNPRSSQARQPAHPADSQPDKPTSRRARGGRRGRSRGGRGRRSMPANRAQVIGPPPPSVANAEVAPSVPMEPSSKAPIEDRQLVLIGSPLRKVHVSATEYLKAFRETEPQGAVALILRAVFPDSVLCNSGVTGNQATGVQQLDPNRIEAIREWLAEMFPRHDLNVRGTDWATCLGAISNVIKSLRAEQGRA
ncbi:hypothetical protein SKAU_G00256800 [Synaphobranchus kaupii]|uniref:BEN domain-containing protein n=1 Tax=Synaphobranchus kaupii TaxID=118154 RepID=A0A9Q1F3Y3_SYNKA|nr:hypothetical protein SKAU_G00256800 [Synaphobranchus kaupii]